VDFGGGPRTSAGGADIFVAKYSPSGAHLWSKRWGGAGDETAGGVAVDGSGNVFVVGYFYGTTDLGGGPLTSAGGADLFIAKYAAADGSYVWGKRIGSASDDVAYAVAVDGSGAVLLGASFTGTVDFGGGPVPSQSNWDVAVVKYTNAGAWVWNKTFVSSGNDLAYGIAADASGNVVMTGTFSGGIDFGGGALWTAGSSDVFLVKLTGAGNYVWARRMGGAYDDASRALTVDGSGNAIVTGYFYGTVDFGTGAYTSLSFDMFVAKYAAANGAPVWARAAGGVDLDEGDAVVTDASGNVVVTGSFAGTANFGGGAVTSAGASDVFVAKYGASDGRYLSARRYGASGGDRPGGVDLDGAGNVVLTGNMQGTVDFGAGPMTSAGGNDAFLAKIAP
jgi:hypothetical protein